MSCSIYCSQRCLGPNEARSWFWRLPAVSTYLVWRVSPAIQILGGDQEFRILYLPCQKIQWFSNLFAHFVHSRRGKLTIVVSLLISTWLTMILYDTIKRYKSDKAGYDIHCIPLTVVLIKSLLPSISRSKLLNCKNQRNRFESEIGTKAPYLM